MSARQNIAPAVVEERAEHPVAVLVAEDDAVFRRVLERWLNAWGYDALVVGDGMAAWNAMQRPDTPQLAILDWMMPGLDGVHLCRKLRSRDGAPYAYILLVTAKTAQDDVIAGLEAGADDYIRKPFDAAELQARLRAGARILQLQGRLMAANEALRHQATHDSLTGLLNRSAILDCLEREWARALRLHDPIAVVMADLDHFKEINDSYGHHIGDEVLRRVGPMLTASVRAYDAAGRYGGEEFLIVLSGCSPGDAARRVEDLRVLIQQVEVVAGLDVVHVTISAGLAVSTGERLPSDSEMVLRAADAALYQAKSKGRNRLEVVAV